jgi:hypothetical protein
VVYADDGNLLSGHKNIVKNTDVLLDASEEFRLEVKGEESKYMFLYRAIFLQ